MSKAKQSEEIEKALKDFKGPIVKLEKNYAFGGRGIYTRFKPSLTKKAQIANEKKALKEQEERNAINKMPLAYFLDHNTRKLLKGKGK